MESDQSRYKTLSNGAVYDMESKRIVKGAALSSAEAASLASQRASRRQEIARMAANKAVERADYASAYGDMAYMAAIIEAAMLKATTPEDNKSIEAAKFIVSMTGDSEPAPMAASSEPAALAEVKAIIHEIADMARAIRASADDSADGVTIITAASEPASSEPA